MIEDYELCTHFRYHQQKIRLFIEAMRNHRDALEHEGFKVVYHELNMLRLDTDYFEKLKHELVRQQSKKLLSFFIEDKFFRDKLSYFCKKEQIQWEVHECPLFLNSEQEIVSLISNKKPFMKTFYEAERIKRNILLTKDKKPLGGKYSFDQENRKKLPKSITIPPLPSVGAGPHHERVTHLVKKVFNNHPGTLDAHWLPTTRKEALGALKEFIHQRLFHFGPYEDALDQEHPFLFHSVLSPLINMGLLTPGEVVQEALKYGQKENIPLNSLEGFVRQIIGWREFVRGIYEKFSHVEESSNFFNHQRTFERSWYEGATGIAPLDQAIEKAWRFGYCHHIERLMVISNIMLLSEIHPTEVHRWFMEMFVDSADWVMGPNVYGMGQFSDGGLFTTKPYVCGSNYLLKMSNYKKDSWCDVLDGLYWHFIDKHRDFFSTQARSSMMPKLLDRMDAKRKNYLFSLAKEFIAKNTQAFSKNAAP